MCVLLKGLKGQEVGSHICHKAVCVCVCDYWFWVGGGHFSHSDKWLLGCQKAWTSMLVSYIYTLPESDVFAAAPEDL